MKMNLIPWRNGRNRESSPANVLPATSSLSDFRSAMNQLFHQFFRDPWFEQDWAAPSLLAPSLDIAENDSEITVKAEVPGVDPEKIEVSLDGDLLSLSGEKEDETEERRGNRYHAERTFGSFHRTIRLPAEVDPDQVHAEYTNGVLTIRMKRSAATSRRRIAVKTR